MVKCLSGMTRWERMAEHKGRGDQADIRNFFARRVGRPRKANYGLLIGDTKIPAFRTAGAGKAAGLLERLLVEKNI